MSPSPSTPPALVRCPGAVFFLPAVVLFSKGVSSCLTHRCVNPKNFHYTPPTNLMNSRFLILVGSPGGNRHVGRRVGGDRHIYLLGHGWEGGVGRVGLSGSYDDTWKAFVFTFSFIFSPTREFCYFVFLALPFFPLYMLFWLLHALLFGWRMPPRRPAPLSPFFTSLLSRISHLLLPRTYHIRQCDRCHAFHLTRIARSGLNI